MAFRSLGVVVIDEQHRFGVEQRAALRQKGADGADTRCAGDDRHADPAHRGDDGLRRPRRVGARRDAARAGRRSSTRWVRSGSSDDPAVEQSVDGERSGGRGVGHGAPEVAAGRQAYVVCPLIEESDKLRGPLGRGDVRAACAAASSPGCGSGCCTDACRARTRKRPWTSSGRASSTCWCPPR